NPAAAADAGLPLGDEGARDAAGADPAAMDAFYAKLVPQGRMGRPEEVARLVLFLSCADSSYVTGQPFVVDGGWLAGVSVV
ncbi:SDR family oxidoreductase, partial [Streptomyces albus]